MRHCGVCNTLMPKAKGSGRWRMYCGDDCLNVARFQKKKEKLEARKRCNVPECNKPARSDSASLCETHYYRKRRNGHVHIVKKKFSQRPNGYIVRNGQPDHPLSNRCNSIYEHRYQAYKKYGGICQPCYWCECDLDWDSCVIDHLNEDKADNSHENLVIACNNCNRARGAMIPFIKKLNPAKLLVLFRIFITAKGL